MAAEFAENESENCGYTLANNHSV